MKIRNTDQHRSSIMFIASVTVVFVTLGGILMLGLISPKSRVAVITHDEVRDDKGTVSRVVIDGHLFVVVSAHSPECPCLAVERKP